ncbi:MAK10-like protein [Tanacetum coccineum]
MNPRKNTFTFCEPKEEALNRTLETSFEARVRDYMAAHTERIERFENAIFKQREEINDMMAKMFGLLKELTTSRSPEKILVREEARHHINKHINSISLIRMEEEKSVRNNELDGENIVKPNKSNVTETLEEVDGNDEVKNRTNNEPVRSVKEKLTRIKGEELVEVPSSCPVGYYLKHKINEKLINDLVNNQRFNDSLLATRVGLKDMDALVDQGSNVNVIPHSTYNRLTNERPAETDIKLSLASHSYIYPLGIAKDVLVEVAGYVYPVDFLILDIKEDEKRPFILGTQFLTTTRAVIKFDKGTITLRYGKNKISFHKIPKPLL